jgi:hypothetical protein
MDKTQVERFNLEQERLIRCFDYAELPVRRWICQFLHREMHEVFTSEVKENFLTFEEHGKKWVVMLSMEPTMSTSTSNGNVTNISEDGLSEKLRRINMTYWKANRSEKFDGAVKTILQVVPQVYFSIIHSLHLENSSVLENSSTLSQANENNVSLPVSATTSDSSTSNESFVNASANISEMTMLKNLGPNFDPDGINFYLVPHNPAEAEYSILQKQFTYLTAMINDLAEEYSYGITSNIINNIAEANRLKVEAEEKAQKLEAKRQEVLKHMGKIDFVKMQEIKSLIDKFWPSLKDNETVPKLYIYVRELSADDKLSFVNRIDLGTAKKYQDV